MCVGESLFMYLYVFIKLYYKLYIKIVLSFGDNYGGELPLLDHLPINTEIKHHVTECINALPAAKVILF